MTSFTKWPSEHAPAGAMSSGDASKKTPHNVIDELLISRGPQPNARDAASVPSPFQYAGLLQPSKTLKPHDVFQSRVTGMLHEMPDAAKALAGLDQGPGGTEASERPDPNQRFKAAYRAALEADPYYTRGLICLGSIQDFPDTDWLGLDDEKIIIRFDQVYITCDLGNLHGYIIGEFVTLFNSCFSSAAPSSSSPYRATVEGSFSVQNQRECHARYTKIADGTVWFSLIKKYVGVLEVGVFGEGIVELVVDASVAFNGSHPIEYFYAIKYSERDHSLRVMLFRRLRPEEFVLEDKGASKAARERGPDTANFGCKKDIERSNIMKSVEANETGRFLDAILLYNLVYHRGDVVHVPIPSEWLGLERGTFHFFSLSLNIWDMLGDMFNLDQVARIEHQERYRFGQV